MRAEVRGGNIIVSPPLLTSGCSCLSSRWRGGALQHGPAPPGLGLHQPHRHHAEQSGGVGGPPSSTLRGAAQGVAGSVRDT